MLNRRCVLYIKLRLISCSFEPHGLSLAHFLTDQLIGLMAILFYVRLTRFLVCPTLNCCLQSEFIFVSNNLHLSARWRHYKVEWTLRNSGTRYFPSLTTRKLQVKFTVYSPAQPKPIVVVQFPHELDTCCARAKSLLAFRVAGTNHSVWQSQLHWINRRWSVIFP